MSGFDVLIEGGTVVTLDERERVFEGDVLIRGGRIHQVSPRGKTSPRAGARTVDARGCYVMPGFVQPHVHLCQVLFRGHAEDLPLMEWLRERIWPFEGAHTEASLRASARLGLAELLLGGTTSILDMGTVQHTDALFAAALESGIRYTGGKAMMDEGQARPAGLRETAAQSLGESNRLADAWHGAGSGRLRYAYAPRFILSCSEGLIRDTVQEARARGCLVHTHASENPGEIEAVRAATGKDNVEALHALGCTGDDVVLAHCVWLTSTEQRILADTKTGVAHCPSANLKLGSGVAKIPELLEQGVRVGIATDGAPCNNSHSAFSEMRLAGLLAKPRLGTDALSAKDVLKLATLGGARVLGLQDEVGSLEKGKRGDVIVIDAAAPHMRPKADPYTTLVYAAQASDVRHVFVDGAWVVRDSKLVYTQVGEILDEADRESAALLERAGA
jgi:5-methylthioadenosine/S-adenosylhomocysteine deaminase